jgi:hypothetical protein|tara:strand:- start:148 stop:381 length:234 start_codon:yes stop_codon:yes gene_type:complete
VTESKLGKFFENKLVKSFIVYSIFRAFYGAGILLLTWIFATNTQAPTWVSVLFLLFSMVFSRVLLKQIKKRQSKRNE